MEQLRSQHPIRASFEARWGLQLTLIPTPFVNLQSDLKNEDGIPRNLMILPRAPALAKTPRLTSGKANDALVLAITRSLMSKVKEMELPIDHHLKTTSFKSVSQSYF